MALGTRFATHGLTSLRRDALAASWIGVGYLRLGPGPERGRKMSLPRWADAVLMRTLTPSGFGSQGGERRVVDLALKAVRLATELIDPVCARVRERLPDEQAGPCASFVRQYFHRVPAEDLAASEPVDLYGAAVAHWNLAQQRVPGRAKVHVANPDSEQHGWQSDHTVLEIVTDDMPFLVDSVTMALTRLGYSIELLIHPVIHVRRDEHGALLDVLEPELAGDGAIPEWIMHAEVVRETDGERLRELYDGIERVLAEVRLIVEDSESMRGHVGALIDELDRQALPIDQDE